MSIVLTPQGVCTLISLVKYQVEDIIDMDDHLIIDFCKKIYMPQSGRYQLLYFLSLNDLLIIKDNYNSIDWVLQHRDSLIQLDEFILNNSGELCLKDNSLKITGKRSNLFKFLTTIKIKTIQTGSFESSFHLFPDKFLGGTDRINDPITIRNKIRMNIEKEFSLSPQLIERTFDMIDQEYFSKLLLYRLKATGKKLNFKISNKMIKIAGSMTNFYFERKYEIAISSRLEEVVANKFSSGAVDAFLLTLQHEITHLIVHLEMERLGLNPILEPKTNALFKPHGSLFKNIGERFFGLSETVHRFFDSDEEQQETVSKDKLSIGTKVAFLFKDESINGKIVKLNPKNAKIQIDNNQIYNVPYNLITIVL